MHPDISPFPAPNPAPQTDEAEFWAFARRGELRFQHCTSCATWRHPPVSVCSACGSENAEWAPAPREARVFSWTKVHATMHPTAPKAVPYFVALIEFPEAGIRMAANWLDEEPPHIGQHASLIWRIDSNGGCIPAFAPKRAP